MKLTASTTCHVRGPVQFTNLGAWKPLQRDPDGAAAWPQLRMALAGLLGVMHLAGAAAPALAHIPLAPLSLSGQQSRALSQIGGTYTTPPRLLRDEADVRRQIQAAMQLMQTAANASAAGDWDAALAAYSSVAGEFPDFAIAEYARIGRAQMLFQLGHTPEAILQLRDEEVVLRGRPEVHAALTAMLWASGEPELRLDAERQWEVACEFDRRYTQPEWVRLNKHWPPRLLHALENFLTIS